MSYAFLQFALFLVCFGLSFYALWGMRFDALWKHPDRQKALIFLFLVSLIMGYLASQPILSLKVLNGFAR